MTQAVETLPVKAASCLPQGVYPVSSDLMLNGELVGDRTHELQLVLWQDQGRGLQLRVAAHRPI